MSGIQKECLRLLSDPYPFAIDEAFDTYKALVLSSQSFPSPQLYVEIDEL